MCPYRAAVGAVVLGLVLPSAAVACLWDYDTIKMERTRFPSALELITGKFLRHSPEFYRWRIENRLKRLEADPTNVSLLDDLATAYDKTGQHAKAIETAQKTEQLRPGRYETAANLGTFYFHFGKLEEGLPHIDRALAINPDAHFGRERYQKALVEYVVERKKGGPLKLPLSLVPIVPDDYRNQPDADKFARGSGFDMHLGRVERRLPSSERQKAVQGVLGMMKFGSYDSPILLEALGTLLVDSGSPEADAKLLAARAFLKASYEVPDEPARDAYRELAKRALDLQVRAGTKETSTSLVFVEADFKEQLEEGRAWCADLRERELSWIRDGKDPEAEFDKLYDTEPEVSGMDVQDPMDPREWLRWLLIGVGTAAAVTFLASLIGIGFVIRHVRRKRKERDGLQA